MQEATVNKKKTLAHCHPYLALQDSINCPISDGLSYSVVSVKSGNLLTFGWLIDALKQERTSLDRVVVFCRSLHTCVSLYKVSAVNLREEGYEPIGSVPNVSKCIFAMYHSDESDKRHLVM